jgi:hypothetical protein
MWTWSYLPDLEMLAGEMSGIDHVMLVKRIRSEV